MPSSRILPSGRANPWRPLAAAVVLGMSFSVAPASAESPSARMDAAVRAAVDGRTKFETYFAVRTAELTVRDAVAQAVLSDEKGVPRAAQLAFARLAEVADAEGFRKRSEAYASVSFFYRQEVRGLAHSTERGELVDGIWKSVDDRADQALAMSAPPGGSDERAKEAGGAMGKAIWSYARAEARR